MANRQDVNRALRYEIFERDGWKCYWCGSKVYPPSRTNRRSHYVVSLEHLVPVHLGGDNDPSNLTTAGRRCNNARGHKLSGPSQADRERMIAAWAKEGPSQKRKKEYTGPKKIRRRRVVFVPKVNR